MNLCQRFFFNSCCCLVAKLCLTLMQPHELWPARLLCPWGFPGKSTGVDCHFLLQGIFLTQGLNPCLMHCRAGSFPLSHAGSPRKGLCSEKCLFPLLPSVVQFPPSSGKHLFPADVPYKNY